MEANSAALEKVKYGISFASGLAATHALMSLVKSGDHIIVSNNVYGGTYRLFEQNLTAYGLEYSWVDTSNLSNIENAIKKNTKMVFVETPTNPMLVLTVLKEFEAITKKNDWLSVCDNTFIIPNFQNLLSFEFDIVLHITKKYLKGITVFIV